MSKYEINIGTSIFSIPNVTTSNTTLNTPLVASVNTTGFPSLVSGFNTNTTLGSATLLSIGQGATTGTL